VEIGAHSRFFCWHVENSDSFGGAMLQFKNYQRVFRDSSFRVFWLGFTFSVLGDAMSRVALTWYVYDLTGSARALGLLTLAYTGPVILGGLIAGSLLDRFERRKVMLVDNVVRGLAVSLVPALYAAGRLEPWHIYAVAGVYGSMMMISLAGGPALIPALVKPERLDTANALETLSFTLSGVIGPPVAGLLIARIGAPNVILLDAISYFVFARALSRITTSQEIPIPGQQRPRNLSLSGPVHLLLSNPILLSTTLMFMAFNIGYGFLTVWLPIYSDQMAGGGPELYGALLGAIAVGEVFSASLVGSFSTRKPIGLFIALAQTLSGVALAVLLLGTGKGWVIFGLLLLGLFSAPLTIWAQTLRMQIIPERLRGRTFALLRTLMQGAFPLGGAVAGFIMPVVGIPIMIALSATMIGTPGILGLRVKDLTRAGAVAQLEKNKIPRQSRKETEELRKIRE
jgi:MFS family permease